MQLIDFARQYGAYVHEQVQQMGEKIDDRQIEALADTLYDAWCDTPQDFLEGYTPNNYFDQYDDAVTLLAQGFAYLEAHMQVPDALAARIVALGAEDQVLAAFRDAQTPLEARLFCVELLGQMRSAKPLGDYVDIIVDPAREEELANAVAEVLRAGGADVAEACLVALARAKGDPAAREILLDVLADQPHREAVYQALVTGFADRALDRSVTAQCLGRYGDARAAEVLQRAMQREELSYFEYQAMMEALEALGTFVDIPREFHGDADYELLAHYEPPMQEE